MTSPQRASVRFECVIPILSVASLPASLDFYLHTLGFQVDWQGGGMAQVSREGGALMLCEGAQGHPGTWVWIGVADIVPLHGEFAARGAPFEQDPTNYSWAYEMRVRDPDGHILRFGSDALTDRPFA